MEERSFVGDILEQSQALKEAVSSYPEERLAALIPRIESGEIMRIVMAGHGSSYNAIYPAYLLLSQLPIPVSLWQTAELLKYGTRQIDSRTLLVLNSQSGRSVEVEHLVNELASNRPTCLVAFTNYIDSPLGRAADITIPLMAGEEHGVATKTYINSLALSILFGVQLNNGDHSQARDDFQSLGDEMKGYLEYWENKLEVYGKMIGACEHVIVVGRGPSMATALNGAINQKEAAWNFSEGMNAAEFRHGPLELADEKLTIFIVEGDEKTRKNNQALAREVQSYEGKVIWIGNHAEEGIDAINVPSASEIAQPAAEIVAMQLVAQAMAKNKGIEAGKFRRIGKVVRIE
jgi:glucosamine--fructose-6-phosphate aminotransferase (isomerizing)